jgi:hypothetical protein
MRSRPAVPAALMALRPPSSLIAVSALCWLMALLILLSFLWAASSGEGPLSVVLQCLALAIIPLAIWTWLTPGARPPAFALALLALVVLTPLVHLIPLPVEVWTRLPMRARVVEMMQAAGLPLTAMPLSLTPGKTWDGFLWLLPPTALFLGAAALDLRQRLWLTWVLVLVLAASVGLAALQISSGYARIFQMYGDVHGLLPIGFFANRNHQAAALAAALPMMAAATMIWRRSLKVQWTLPQLVFVGLLAMFVTGILITTSRAGLGVGAMGIAASLAIYLLGSRNQGGFKGQPWWLLAIAFLVVVIVQIAVGAVLARFDTIADEGRFVIWPTVMTMARDAWPAGTGIGSFTVIYDAYEPISDLSASWVNEAHNEFLQQLLETGLVFPVLFVGFLGWVGSRLMSLRHSRDWNYAALSWASVAAMSILMVASFVDYPLRTAALGCVFAVLCALLTPLQSLEGAGRKKRRRSAGNT